MEKAKNLNYGDLVSIDKNGKIFKHRSKKKMPVGVIVPESKEVYMTTKTGKVYTENNPERIILKGTFVIKATEDIK